MNSFKQDVEVLNKHNHVVAEACATFMDKLFIFQGKVNDAKCEEDLVVEEFMILLWLAELSNMVNRVGREIINIAEKHAKIACENLQQGGK